VVSVSKSGSPGFSMFSPIVATAVDGACFGRFGLGAVLVWSDTMSLQVRLGCRLVFGRRVRRDVAVE